MCVFYSLWINYSLDQNYKNVCRVTNLNKHMTASVYEKWHQNKFTVSNLRGLAVEYANKPLNNNPVVRSPTVMNH